MPAQAVSMRVRISAVLGLSMRQNDEVEVR
jgi:hypothetical protein